VIGDGSMTGGMAYEALNNIGHSRQRVVIVLNDNGRSYAPTISNLIAPPSVLETPVERPTGEQQRLPDRITEKLAHSLTSIRMNPVYVPSPAAHRALPS
jgi:1-deoxy-D-xylulose-5-phosphate synthase